MPDPDPAQADRIVKFQPQIGIRQAQARRAEKFREDQIGGGNVPEIEKTLAPAGLGQAPTISFRPCMI